MAEEEAQNLEFLPHPKFWPFLGRPLKDVLPANNIVRVFSQKHGLCPFRCLGGLGFRCVWGSGVQVFRCLGFRCLGVQGSGV